MERTQIEELVTHIKSSELNSLFPGGVYPYNPRQDKDKTILTITEIDEDTMQVQEDSFIEFRVIAGDTNTNPLDIKDSLKKVKNLLTKNDIIIGNTKYFQIDSMSGSRVGLNGKRRYEGIQSFIFKA